MVAVRGTARFWSLPEGVFEGVLGVLLVHEDGSCLSRYQFITVFRRCIQGLGLLPVEFCSHSFRIGAATEAARWGLSEEVIKQIGRWETARYRSYVRPPLVIPVGLVARRAQ